MLLLNQYQGYEALFFVDFCRLVDDISWLEQDQGSKVHFFVDYLTNNHNRQNRLNSKIFLSII